MARKQVSGAQLARRVDRSNSYIAKRLRGDGQFTANDIEDIAKALDEDLLVILAAAVRAARR
jgi:transcriptional regulator with XRE-family HTH domain